jgi:ABC-type polysaccharide/polyol phosphate transport system ATPase subunit
MARIHLAPDLPEEIRFEGVSLSVSEIQRRSGRSRAQRIRRLAGDTRRMKVELLSDVNLSVASGESVAIIPGAAAAGVQEFFRLAAGTLIPDSGAVHRRNHVIPMLARSGLLNQSITVRQNIWVIGLLLGMSPEQINERWDWIVRFSGLEKVLDTYTRQCSPLLRRRIIWVVTMATQARAYAIQRSLVVGDEAFQEVCWEHLEALRADGVTFLVEAPDAMLHRFCDRAVVLGDGHVLAETTVAEGVTMRHAEDAMASRIRDDVDEDDDEWRED